MQNVQDILLRHVAANRTRVTIFLRNGIKLQGIVVRFDAFTVLLRRDGIESVVYKSAISTILPVTPVPL